MEHFKNKQLVFLEKDYKCPSSDDCIDSAKRFLESWLNLPTEQVDAMIIHYQFNQMDREELTKIMFNPENIIVTYSVYTQGSDAMFKRYMASTALNSVKGLTYIDASGALIQYLNRNLKDVEKNLFEIISAINTNNIISIDYNRPDRSKKLNPELLRVQINGMYENCVQLKELNDENIIPIDEKLFNRTRVRK